MLDDFHSGIASCANDKQLAAFIRTKYDSPPGLILQSLRSSVGTKRLDLLGHALRMNTLLPPDSLFRADDDQILQLMQKAVTMEEMEVFRALLPHIRNPEKTKTKTELQSLAILAAQFGRILAVRLLCFNYATCLDQTIQGRSVFLEVARAPCDDENSLESILSDLLEMGVYINVQEPDGNTALHITVERGDSDAVKMLLSNGACSNIPNAEGKKAMDLCESTKLSLLLKQSPPSHESSLYHAAEKVDFNCIGKLLDQDIPIDSKWIHGRTALAAAAKVGSVEMVNFLLSLGAAPIPLGCYWPELPIVHAMVNNHTNISLKLMENTEKYLTKATSMEQKHIKKQLIWLLHYCAQVGATNIANLILRSQCRINPNTDFRNLLAPIHVACKYGQLSMVKLLLIHHCKPDLPSEVYYNTPLHYACFYGQIEVAKFLVKQPSVDVNCKNIQHETPLYCVLRCQLTPYEKNSFIQEASVIFLFSNGATLIKPGRRKCELKEFNLDVGAQRWTFVPVQTQKLMMVLRDEGTHLSLASATRLTIRGAIQAPVSLETVGELGLPYRLQNYVLLRDWFS